MSPAVRETRESLSSTFAPLAHKTRHSTGGADALTPSDIGALAVDAYKTYVPCSAVPNAVGGGGSWAWTQSATYYSGYTSVGNSSGNYVEHTVYAPAGTYTLTVAYVKSGFGGIAAISIDGGAALGTTIDMYAASLTNNQSTAITSITIATSGLHTVRFTSTTKNASSSGYYIYASGFSLTRTGA